NRFHAHSHVTHNDPRFADQVGDGRGEYGVEPRNFPTSLQQNREGQPLLLDLRAILLRLAPADHYHVNIPTDTMELLQLRREMIARSAMRIRENQQHAMAAKILQRDFASV